MASVDRSAPSRDLSQIWGYWVPEPALLLGPRVEERTIRYLLNWLRIREPWLYLLALPDPPVTRVKAQWWRDYLNGDTADATPATESRHAKRLKEVKDVFCRVFNIDEYDSNSSGKVAWFDHSLVDLEPTLAPTVIWEVFELGFRHELLALDRLLVPMNDVPEADSRREEILAEVFDARDVYRLHALPESGVGLSAKVPERRARCIQGLRDVVIRWPMCPPEIVAGPALGSHLGSGAIEDMERAVAAFYVQVFFAYSGRAPIVPHAHPHDILPAALS